MTKTVVIHQPDFASYLGFFHRFLRADLFIALDHVQFVNGTSRSWTHRDKIKTRTGEKWLTLSIKKAPRSTPINRIELSDSTDWASGNLNLLHDNYRLSAFYHQTMPLVEELYTARPPRMADFNLRFNQRLMSLLDIDIPTILSSNLAPAGSKNEMLVNLLRNVGATRYISGTGARAYLDETVFAAAGIEVIWQEFHHPSYPQQFDGFIPYLSVLDALFNCGASGTRDLLRGVA